MESQIPFFFIIASLFVVLLALNTLFKPKHATSRLPPGPPTLPVIGNLHQLAGGLPHRTLASLSKLYGPIMHVKLGQVTAVVVSSPRIAKEVLTTHDIVLAQRPKTVAMGVLFYGCTDVACSSYSEYWRQMKKVCILELLSAKKVRSFSDSRGQETGRLVASIRSLCGSPVNFSQLNIENTNNMICRATFGDNCKDQTTLIELIDNLLHLADGFAVADLFPSMKALDFVSGLKPKLLKMHRKLDKIFDDIFEAHEVNRSHRSDDEEEDLVDALFRIKRQLEYPITFDNIKAILMDVLTAGTVTSAATKDWAMTELMRHPEVMKKVQAEVRKAFDGKTAITEDDMQGLTYLKMVVKETLRLHPTGTLLPRECIERCTINGYEIPVKTRVIINAWACSHDPKYWEDPNSFVPERFEKGNVDFAGTDYQFLAFGAGRRMCPGMSYGLASIEFPLAQLLYHFDWELAYGMNPKDVDMTEKSGITTSKKVHLHLIPSAYSPA